MTVSKSAFSVYYDNGFIVTYILCLLFSKPIFKLSEALINWRRTASHKTKQLMGDTLDHILDNDRVQSIFIFDFSGSLIADGVLEFYSVNQTLPLQMSLVPFDDREIVGSYDDIINQLSTKDAQEDYAIKQLVDFEKKIKIIVVTEIEN